VSGAGKGGRPNLWVGGGCCVVGLEPIQWGLEGLDEVKVQRGSRTDRPRLEPIRPREPCEGAVAGTCKPGIAARPH
jgi:hypothetical protein